MNNADRFIRACLEVDVGACKPPERRSWSQSRTAVVALTLTAVQSLTNQTAPGALYNIPSPLQVIICFSELGVPEALAKGPKTGRQLAAELKVQQDYLERVLRVAERLKVVRATYIDRSRSVKQYHITQLSAVLCGGHVNSVKHMVGLFGDHFPAFAHLTEGVRTGQTPYKLYAKGQSHWEHMMAEPELYTRFNK